MKKVAIDTLAACIVALLTRAKTPSRRVDTIIQFSDQSDITTKIIIDPMPFESVTKMASKAKIRRAITTSIQKLQVESKKQPNTPLSVSTEMIVTFDATLPLQIRVSTVGVRARQIADAKFRTRPARLFQ